MAVASIASFVEALRDSQLLERAQLEEIGTSLLARCNDPRSLGRELIQRGWLTPYQVNQLVQGHAKDLTLGSYRLLERLGAGGMGQVFKARHQALNKIVALKVIRKEYLQRPDAGRRFLREIRASAQLSHPNIVMAYDADQIGETLFYAMEYVEGINLSQRVKQSGPLPIAVACDYMRQTALGLQHAHERGLVHRDIKPANLLLCCQPGAAEAGVIKILDMGLARLETAQETMTTFHTQEGHVLGTPDYIAPEQAVRSSAADARADLYSLGCTLYFLLSGHAPFAGGSVLEKLLKHRLDDPEPIEKLRPDVPPELAAVLRKLMAKNPEERYQTPAEAAAALAPLAARSPRSIQRPAVTLLAEANAPAGSARAIPVTRLVPATSNAPMAIPLADNISKPGSVPMAIPSAGHAPPAGNPPLAVPLAKNVSEPNSPPSAIPIAKRYIPPPLPTGKVEPSASNSARLPKGRPLRLPAAFFRFARSWSKRKTIWVGEILLLGALLLVVTLFPVSERPSSVDNPATRTGDSLDDQLQRLIAKAVDPQSDKNAVRQELIEFRTRFPGTAQALRAAFELSRMPAPLDRLKAAYLAPEERALAFSSQDLIAVLGEHRRQHWDAVTSVAVSANGKWLASGDASGNIYLWDAADQRPRTMFKGHAAAVHALAFASSDKFLASAGADGSLRIWISLNKPQEKFHFPSREGNTLLAWSPEGNALLFGAADGSVRLLDFSDHKSTEPRLLTKLKSAPAALAFAAKDRMLAANSFEENVDVWQLGGEEAEPIKLEGQPAPVAVMAFSPDGKRLACQAAQALQLWSLAGAAPQKIAEIKDAKSTALVFAPHSNRLAAVEEGGSVRVWSFKEEGLSDPLLLQSPARSACAVAFAPDGSSLVSGCSDGTIHTWALDEDKPRERFAVKEPLAGAATLSFRADGKTLAVGFQGNKGVQLWDPLKSSAQQAPPLKSDGYEPVLVAFSPDGALLAVAGSDHAIRILDLTGSKPKETRPLRGHDRPVSALAFSPDGKTLASGSADKTVWLWGLDERPHKKIDLPLETGDSLSALAFTPDGKTLATGSQKGTVHFWDRAGAEARKRLVLSGPATRIQALAFSPEGPTLALAAGPEGNIRFWDMKKLNPRESASSAKHDRALTALVYSPTGQNLVALDDRGRILLWTTDMKKKPREWALPGKCAALSLSDDGRYLASANSNGTVYVLRIRPMPGN